jgi:hypothetical protein
VNDTMPHELLANLTCSASDGAMTLTYDEQGIKP